MKYPVLFQGFEGVNYLKQNSQSSFLRKPTLFVHESSQRSLEQFQDDEWFVEIIIVSVKLYWFRFDRKLFQYLNLVSGGLTKFASFNSNFYVGFLMNTLENNPKTTLAQNYRSQLKWRVGNAERYWLAFAVDSLINRRCWEEGML